MDTSSVLLDTTFAPTDLGNGNLQIGWRTAAAAVLGVADLQTGTWRNTWMFHAGADPTTQCTLAGGMIGKDNVAWHFYYPSPEGWISGGVDSALPERVMHGVPLGDVQFSSSWSANDDGVTQQGIGDNFTSWSGSGGWTQVYAPAQDPHGSVTGFTYGRKALSFLPTDNPNGTVYVSNHGSPAVGLVGIASPLGRAAADFGTDETDMVWTEGTGTVSHSVLWSQIDVWTAKYSLDPITVSKSAVHVGPINNIMGLHAFQVGCGYAAKCGNAATASGTAGVGGLYVVRLADGAKWYFADAGSSSKDPTFRSCDDVMAVSCDTILAKYEFVDDAGPAPPKWPVELSVSGLGQPTGWPN